MIKFLLLSVCLLVSACSTTGLYLLNSSVKLKSQHTVKRNVQYAQQNWQQLDLHIPTEKTEQARPVLIFFYGGSWYTGKKEQYFFAADAFTRLGYIVVIPDYLKAPQAKFPQFIEDGAAAIAWTKSNIAAYGGNPDAVFVSGHSAGAHLGGLVLSDAEYLQPYDLLPTDVRGFAGLAGPYNFTPTEPEFIKVFGSENFEKMKMMNFINGDEPAMLLMHGLKDETVGVQNKNASIAQLEAAGVPYQDIEYNDATHVGMVLSLTPRFSHQASTVRDMNQFFQAQLKK